MTALCFGGQYCSGRGERDDMVLEDRSCSALRSYRDEVAGV
jgi:hypothetical protein